MASSLALKQLLSRSYAAVPLRAVATSSNRLLNTQRIGPAPVFRGPAVGAFNGYNVRGFSTKSFFSDACNRFSTTRKLIRLYNRILSCPERSTRRIQPARSKEDSEYLYLYLHLTAPSGDDVKISVNHGTIYVEALDVRNFVKHISWIELPDIDSPDKIYKTCGIKAEMRVRRGELELAIPKLKKDEKVHDVIKVDTVIDD